MHTDEDFLSELTENPTDRATRMAYADWLEENGESGKAALLRTLLAFHALTDTEKCKLNKTLSENAEKIMGLGSLIYTLHHEQPLWTLTLDEFINPANLEKLFLYADLTCVRITGIEDRMQELAACPHLRAITKLDLGSNEITSTGVRILADSAHLCNLADLDLSYNDIGDTGIQALARSPHLSRLTSLNLCRNCFGTTGVRALASSVSIHNLTTLSLSHNWLGPDAAVALANSANMHDLTRLYLHGGGIEDAGISAIANSAHMGRLTRLYLWDNHIGDIGVQALAASAHMRNLTHLDLSNNRISSVGAIALAESGLVSNVPGDFDLRNNLMIDNAGVEAIRAAITRRPADHVPSRHDTGLQDAPPGKWRQRTLRDTDRSLHPAIA